MFLVSKLSCSFGLTESWGLCAEARQKPSPDTHTHSTHSTHSTKKGQSSHTHGRNANQRRAHAGVQAPPEPIARNRLAHHVNGAGVDAALGCLQAHLDQVERVADDDGADSAEAAGREGAQLGEQRGLRRGGSGLGGLFGFLGRGGNLFGDVGDCLGGGGGRGRHGGCELWWDERREKRGERERGEDEEREERKKTTSRKIIREEEVVQEWKELYQR